MDKSSCAECSSFTGRAKNDCSRSAKASEIFQKLRVSQCSEDENVRIQLIFSGVSANSWLSPVGISTAQQQKKGGGPSCGSGAKKPILASECRQAIQARAKSASSVMGRRHFEAGQQLLGKDQVLRGRSALEGRGKKFQELRLAPSGSNVEDQIFDQDRKPASQLQVPFRSSLATYRPQTCGTTRSPNERLAQANRPSTSIPSVEKKMENCPEIQIKPAHPTKPEQDSSDDNRSASYTETRQLGFFDLKRRLALLGDSTVGFRSVEAMKEVFVMRMRSAHGRSPLPACDSNYESVAGNRSRPTKARNLSDKEKDDVRRHAARQPLKPLLYNEDCDIKHGAGCPYNCRGCFRACLASEEFFAGTEGPTGEAAPAKKIDGRKAKRADAIKLKNPLLLGSKSASSRTVYRGYPDCGEEVKLLLATEQRKERFVSTLTKPALSEHSSS